MFYKLFLFFLFSCYLSFSQLTFNNQVTDLGNITEAFEIKGDVLVKNNTDKKVFLMRADADKGIKVYTSKKTLQPNDTCLIIISFLPESSGKFKKKINLISSENNLPYELIVSGNLLKLKTDDKTSCFYFGNRKNISVKTSTTAIAIKDNNDKKDNSNKIPDNSSKPV